MILFGMQEKLMKKILKLLKRDWKLNEKKIWKTIKRNCKKR